MSEFFKIQKKNVFIILTKTQYVKLFHVVVKVLIFHQHG